MQQPATWPERLSRRRPRSPEGSFWRPLGSSSSSSSCHPHGGRQGRRPQMGRRQLTWWGREKGRRQTKWWREKGRRQQEQRRVLARCALLSSTGPCLLRCAVGVLAALLLVLSFLPCLRHAAGELRRQRRHHSFPDALLSGRGVCPIRLCPGSVLP
jgi:hypothetical protein